MPLEGGSAPVLGAARSPRVSSPRSDLPGLWRGGIRPIAVAVLLVAAPLAPDRSEAQDAGPREPVLADLAFMAGCWRGDFQGDTALEEYYSRPSDNLMVGTSRFLRGSRAVQFEFSHIARDSAGIALRPFPGGRPSEHDFRLTALAPGSALFEAPQHDFPRRIRYVLGEDGALTATIDGGDGSERVQSWRMRPVACREEAGVARPGPARTRAPIEPDLREVPELGRHFAAFGAEGTIVVVGSDGTEGVVYHPERARTGFVPASTFKIFNSMVALEAGVVAVDDTIRWDGVERAVAVWNRDQRMREAFQRSVVWFYQELARRIGEERMAAAVRRERYGNGTIGGGIDRFWLTGDLRISAVEQVDLLRRMADRELGFPAPVVAQVQELLVLERCPSYTLRGKTGWETPGGVHLGWMVGWVEGRSGRFFYALNLDSADPDFPMSRARPTIVRAVLEELGVLPEGCA